MNCTIKRDKAGDQTTYTVSFKGISMGKIIAIRRALAKYSSSPVAQDVLGMMNSAISKSGDEPLKKDTILRLTNE